MPTEFDDIIQLEITRITTIKARHYRDITQKLLTAEAIGAFQHNLETWFRNLPAQLRLESLTKTPIDSRKRRLVYFLHLIHLGTWILLYRQALTYHHGVKEAGTIEDPELSTATLSVGSEGVAAAKNAARILHLLLDEGALFKKSWLCV